MLLATILDRPFESLAYLERFVNRGSPSGYSQLFTTSPETSPLGNNQSFRLSAFLCPDGQITNFGAARNNPIHDQLPPKAILLHPDVAARLPCPTSWLSPSLEVSPTASGRTVHALSEPPFHLKLHYDGVIGRLNRQLGIKEAGYAVFVSNAIEQAAVSKKLGTSFAVLPDYYGRVVQTAAPDSSIIEIGMMYRALTPAGPRSPLIHAMVPAFSLFSPDRNNPDHELLLLQLLRASKYSANDFLLNTIVHPLIESYFGLLTQLGMQGEYHAQNILIGIADDASVQAIVLRDMESVDTDLSLTEELHLDLEPPTSLHKTISRGQLAYFIKHSFMFDFKLGEYLLEPLLDTLEIRGLIDRDAMYRAIQAEVATWCERLPEDFFPSGFWYSFAKVQIDRSTEQRPYVKNASPKFRPH